MAWQKISSPGFGIESNSGNIGMTLFRNYLYAAISNRSRDQVELWRTHPSYFMSPTFIRGSWRRIDILIRSRRIDAISSHGDRILVGDNISNLFSYSLRGTKTNLDHGIRLALGISSIRSFRGFAYVVFQGRPFQIWRSDNISAPASWAQVGTNITEDDGSTNFSGVFTSDHRNLFLGTGVESPGGGGLCQIWRSPNGSDWEILVSNSFGDTGNGAIPSLHLFNSKLYATTVNHSSGGKLYEIDLDAIDSFRQITIDNFAPLRSLVSWRGIFYAGEGNNPLGAGLFVKRPEMEFSQEPSGFAQDIDSSSGEELVFPLFLRPLISTTTPSIDTVFVASSEYPSGGAIIWRQMPSGRRYISDWLFELRPVAWLFQRIRFIPIIAKEFLEVWERLSLRLFKRL
ncbi:MAG: hypothetical protein OEQ53_14025 [Saprospiraceae bacterium]|nr:hypothetical protein [Saprospiraceae bacterium]